MRAIVVRLFWCRLSNLVFVFKRSVSAKSLELVTLVVLSCVVVL